MKNLQAPHKTPFTKQELRNLEEDEQEGAANATGAHHDPEPELRSSDWWLLKAKGFFGVLILGFVDKKIFLLSHRQGSWVLQNDAGAALPRLAAEQVSECSYISSS